MPFVAEECQMPGGNDVFDTMKCRISYLKE